MAQLVCFLGNTIISTPRHHHRYHHRRQAVFKHAIILFRTRARCAHPLVGRSHFRKPARSSSSFTSPPRETSGRSRWWCRCRIHIHRRSDHFGLHSSAIFSHPRSFSFTRHHLDHHSRLREQLRKRQRPQPGLRYGFVQWRSLVALQYPLGIRRRCFGYFHVRRCGRCRRCASLINHGHTVTSKFSLSSRRCIRLSHQPTLSGLNCQTHMLSSTPRWHRSG